MALSDPNILLNFANAPTMSDTVRNALFGEQQRQQNQNALDQQARAEQVRQAQARMLIRNAGLDGPEVALPGIVSGYAGGTFDTQGRPVTPVQRGATAEDDADLRIIAEADPAQAQAIIRQRKMQQDYSAVLSDPSGVNIRRFGLAYPEAFKGMKDVVDAMDAAQKDATAKAAADTFAYLGAANDPKASLANRRAAAESAIKVLQQHMDAAKVSGEDVSSYPQLIEAIRRDPRQAQIIAGATLALAAPEGFDKTYGAIGEERRADELQPSKVRQEEATAGIKETEQRFAPAKAQSELETAAAERTRMAAQTANEVARLALDRDKLDLDRDTLTSNIQLKLEEFERNGTQLDAGAKTAVNNAVGASVSSQALADRANDLADRFQASGAGGWGWGSSAREAFRGMYGGQDPITGLRNEYAQIVNQQAVKNLPPGPASDKDIQLAKQGFPPPNAGKDYIVSFLRGMAKMQEAVAAAEDRKANWISVNGSLGPARRDLDVGGVGVPAGTTFGEFNGNSVKRSRQGEAPAGIQSIISKYGGR